MDTAILKELSLLRSTLSKKYYHYFYNSINPNLYDRKRNQFVNIYSSYCFLTKPSEYSAMDILNNESAFNQHFELLVGFIYQQDGIAINSRYKLANLFKNTFRAIAEEKQLRFNNIKLMYKNVSDDAQRCLDNFGKLSLDINKVNYLNGWQVTSKEGKKYQLHLDSIYVTYGVAFTKLIYVAINNYAMTQKSSSLHTKISHFKTHFNAMVQVCPNRREISRRLDEEHVQSFFMDIMNVLFASHLAKQNNPKAFFNLWKQMIATYTECFIDTGIFDTPIKLFIIPEWKSPQGNAPTFSVGGQANEKEKDRWFTNIPLKIKDEEAIAIIQSRLDRDMAHIRHICMMKFEEFKERSKRNTIFLQTGNVKPLFGTQFDHSFRDFLGMNNLANTVATFYEHGFDAKDQYPAFFDFKGNVDILIEELNLPTPSTLSVLLTLLIMEHPLITPSWLNEWKLFDTNGIKKGFKQVGNQYIAVSYKRRRGAINAQQEIVLNDFSRSIVEFLIQHTSFARNHLKRSNKDAWRKMILTASLTKAISPTQLSNFNRAEKYQTWLSDTSRFEHDSSMVKSDAIVLADLISLRSIRKHRGLQIYLETRSMAAVSEALGHKKKDIGLLASYLPEPLMNFFNDRWVRQFQNAILLEAMKDSKYRFDAVNMTAKDIEEFLENHGIRDIPAHFDHGFQPKSNSDDISSESSFDEITFTVSTSLLQLLIAIRSIVEGNNSDEYTFLDIVSDWYQSAVFILSTLTTEQYTTDIELSSMFNKANENALDINVIRGVLTC